MTTPRARVYRTHPTGPGGHPRPGPWIGSVPGTGWAARPTWQDALNAALTLLGVAHDCPPPDTCPDCQAVGDWIGQRHPASTLNPCPPAAAGPPPETPTSNPRPAAPASASSAHATPTGPAYAAAAPSIPTFAGPTPAPGQPTKSSPAQPAAQPSTPPTSEPRTTGATPATALPSRTPGAALAELHASAPDPPSCSTTGDHHPGCNWVLSRGRRRCNCSAVWTANPASDRLDPDTVAAALDKIPAEAAADRARPRITIFDIAAELQAEHEGDT